jgi:aspartyl-tRNA(Asn)/glutamyl-tRNA(Gln) amidotransferase subunit B
MSNSGKYETVIGLEVHVQLATKTKVFCSCSTQFGAEPNTQVCPVCLGQPGSLPVLNKEAFRHSVKIAIALGCDIQSRMKFDRKHYFYPDLPKNYQISQFDMPLAYEGEVNLTLEDGTKSRIGITRAHMEEDAGKLIHDPSGDCSYVDLNRTGTPLLEIVSEPEISSPEEARAYLITLKKIVKFLGVSDCNMEEGSLRCDANISLREKGATKLGNKVEIKNMNSFKAVRDALSYEEKRQAEMLDEGTRIAQETRLWDEEKKITSSMRAKEESHDYKYFPEPDLVPFDISKELIKEVRDSLPELPDAKSKRFKEEYELSDYDVGVLTSEPEIAVFFEALIESSGVNPACNWTKGEMMMHMKERNESDPGELITPAKLGIVINMVKKGDISNSSAKEVLRECIDTGKDPMDIVKEKDLGQVSDKGELEGIVDGVIAANEKSVNDFKSGKENALGFLVGQVMKGSKGKANPKLAGEILRKKITG